MYDITIEAYSGHITLIKNKYGMGAFLIYFDKYDYSNVLRL